MTSNARVFALPFRDLVAIVCRDKWKLAVALVLPPIIAISVAFLLTPRYAAVATLLVKSGREYMGRTDVTGTPGSVALQETKQALINSEIGILEGRLLAERVIKDVGLARLYPDILADPPRRMSVMDTAIAAFAKNMKAESVRLSDMIAVTFYHENLGIATEVANDIVAAFQQAHSRVYSEPHTPFVEDQLQKMEQELQRLENRRTSVRLSAGAYSSDQQRNALISARADAAKQLYDAQSRQSELQVRLKTLQTAAGQVDRAELSSPLMTKVKEERVMTQAELLPLQPRIDALGQTIGNYDQQLQTLEKSDLELRMLDRRIETLGTTVTQSRQRLEDSKILDELDKSKVVSVSVVEPASGSTKPVKPDKLLYAAAGGVAGVALAGLVLLASILMQNTLLSGEGVERALGLPVLVTVPRRPQRLALPSAR